jgi:serine/threonine protein phosphatase PrpC
MTAEKEFKNSVLEFAHLSSSKKGFQSHRDLKIPSKDSSNQLMSTEFDQSGSCVSLILIEKDKIFIGNVGDSRILVGACNTIS